MENNWINRSNQIATELIELDITSDRSRISGVGLKKRVEKFIESTRSAMYPKIYCSKKVSDDSKPYLVENFLSEARVMLYEMLTDTLPEEAEVDFTGKTIPSKDKASEITDNFIYSLPSIAKILRTDIKAAYEGDPAARAEEEILLAYPAFEAISIFRLAHSLFEMGVPLIPRMMTEYAHQITGIDIHPGATIGDHFFIDHGTGVVIGETCTIGTHVKLYQGVTLGAKSFENDEDGNPIKGIKRHPDIGDNVVIYAGATILGGDTRIGNNCVVGGNVWITSSMEDGTSVYYGKNE